MRGDLEEAYRLMDEANIPPALQRFYVRTTQDPSARFASRAFNAYKSELPEDERTRIEQLEQEAAERAAKK